MSGQEHWPTTTATVTKCRGRIRSLFGAEAISPMEVMPEPTTHVISYEYFVSGRRIFRTI